MVATYKYDAEDTDELSFEKGEIISVVPYDDPETQVSVIVTFKSNGERCRRSNDIVAGGGRMDVADLKKKYI